MIVFYKDKHNSDIKKALQCFATFKGLKRVAATYSPTWYSSTIGANGFNFSVRNGKRWSPVAIAT